jgi:predicted NAD/FAD-binding protein
MASIAIIGTGISGMGVASLLHPHHTITVYEQASQIGGHTRTKTIRYDDSTIAVDTGFIVFNYRNYPLLSGLFKHLNVPVQKSDMTFAVTAHARSLEWGAKDLNAVFGQRSNLFRPSFLRLIKDVLVFNSKAPYVAEKNPELTLGGLLKKLGMSQWFADYYILPMGGAIWSCPLQTMLSFPAVNFTRFFKEHGLLSITGQPQWYTVTGGSQEYVSRLIAPFEDRIRVGCGARHIRREDSKVHITDEHGDTQTYDRVILACHADQALAMLSRSTEAEKQALGAIRYQKNRAVLHKDTSVMPQRTRCWASWVYHPDGSQPSDPIAVTYWMNLLQSLPMDKPLFVTLNPAQPIAPEHIFDEHWFEHPVYSPEAVAAQSKIRAIQGHNNTWFCGAYMHNGFHEDGLRSAVDVAALMGISPPWG